MYVFEIVNNFKLSITYIFSDVKTNHTDLEWLCQRYSKEIIAYLRFTNSGLRCNKVLFGWLGD